MLTLFQSQNIATRVQRSLRTMHLSLLLVAAALLTHSSAFADDPLGFEISYELREAERKAIIFKNLKLSKQESDKFWPLYDEYRAETKEQARKNMSLLQRFSKSFQHMPDEEAESIINQALANQLEDLEEKQKHFKKVEEVLSGASLFRYFQIDQRADAVMINNVTRQIPLIPLESLHAEKIGSKMSLSQL